MRHPDVAHNVELAFKAGGKSYYRFKEERLIPAGRYKYIYAYLKEVEMRMDINTLKSYVKDFKDLLNGSGPKKIIQIGELWKLVLNLESRLALAFEPATVERLAAVIYFEEDEDLSTFDRKHGQKKIDHWTKNNVRDFFFDEAYGRITRTEKYFNRIFGGLYTIDSGASSGFDGRSSESILGEFIREWEETFVILADDPEKEKQYRRISIFDFNSRILFLRKHQAKTSKIEDTAFGMK